MFSLETSNTLTHGGWSKYILFIYKQDIYPINKCNDTFYSDFYLYNTKNFKRPIHKTLPSCPLAWISALLRPCCWNENSKALSILLLLKLCLCVLTEQNTRKSVINFHIEISLAVNCTRWEEEERNRQNKDHHGTVHWVTLL